MRRERRAPPYQVPLHGASNETYVTKSRERLREELNAAKLRKKQEKKRLKLEAHEERKRQKTELSVATLEAKLAALTVNSPPRVNNPPEAFTREGVKVEPTPLPAFKPPQRKGHEKLVIISACMHMVPHLLPRPCHPSSICCLQYQHGTLLTMHCFVVSLFECRSLTNWA